MVYWKITALESGVDILPIHLTMEGQLEDLQRRVTELTEVKGDRSHPNLKLIDELKRKLTYVGHKKDLCELALANMKGGINFDGILHRVKEKEKMSKGDRSHPNLVLLDKLIKHVTYDGWRDDFQAAEKEHLYRPFLHFDFAMKRIERKQKISVGDRSDKDLKFLDSLSLSYPGWEKDWKMTVDKYNQGHNLNSSGMRFCLTEKQRMHEGDRSHPRLVALDSLQLTYPGWRADAKKYEQKHVGIGTSGFEVLGESSVQREIGIFKHKQGRYCFGFEGSSGMSPDQRTIVKTQWTFPGWKEEVRRVRKSTSQNFADTLEHFQLRQMMHDEDYSRHPLLIKLKSIKFSYPGWEDDVDKIKCELNSTSTVWKYKLDLNIQCMLSNQKVCDRYARSVKTKIRAKVKQMGERKNGEETGLKECVVCWEAPRTHVFVPCGHICACKSCSEMMIEKRKLCPACNQSSTMAIEVFVP